MVHETAYLAGGCFWCLEAIYKELAGVAAVRPGFMGGTTANPSYREVCTGTTGHAEVVEVTFDPGVVTYDDLLDVFFSIHDPTQLNRQGNDIGTQYRSAIFYRDAAQKAAAEAAVARARTVWDDPVVTEIAPAGPFWPAEAEHFDYFARNPDQPYCAAVVAPKVAKARAKWARKLKRRPA